MSAFRSMMQNGLFVFLPLYLADVLNFGPVWMGTILMLLQVGGMIGGPVAGAWSDRVGRWPVVLGGLGVTTLAIVCLTVSGSGFLFAATVFVLGVAAFAVRPVVHSWLMDLTPPHLGGTATGLLFGSSSGLSILAPAVGGFVADLWGLAAVFHLLAGITLISTLLVFLLPRTAPHGNVD